MYNRTSCTACQIIQLQANNSKLYSQIDDETTAFHHEYSRFQFNDPWPRDSAHKCPQQALPNKEKSKEHPNSKLIFKDLVASMQELAVLVGTSSPVIVVA